jgi:hypothetical protein
VTPSKPQGNSTPLQAPTTATATAAAAAAAATATPPPVSNASSSSSSDSSSSSSSSSSRGSRPDKPKRKNKTKEQLELLRTTYEQVCAANEGQRVTLGEWERILGGDWKVEDFLAELNQLGPTLSRADISKWIQQPTRKTATAADQRMVSLDRSRYINTPAIMKALDDPTAAEVAEYKATHGIKTMTEGKYLQEFAKAVPKSVNTLTNFRICARHGLTPHSRTGPVQTTPQGHP